MPPENPEPELNSEPLERQPELALLQLEPEIIPAGFTLDRAAEQVDSTKSLDELKLESEVKTLQAKTNRIEHELKESRENHELRKGHASHLFILTICWIGVVWLVVIMQGFGRFPVPSLMENYYNLSFKLSDSVLIAFMTSTTATVVGLYGICAYWLFSAKAKHALKKNKKPQKKGASAPKED